MPRPALRILIVTPARKGSRKGNRTTADRWARLLRELGHHVTITNALRQQRFDLIIGLHARYSAEVIRQVDRSEPGCPIVLAMTGTDLYRDLHRRRERAVVVRSLQLADRIVVLHDRAVNDLPRFARDKTRVIYQSVASPTAPVRLADDRFDVVVAGHLRAVKDPFRTAYAVRNLPVDSKIHVTHIGTALTTSMAMRAEREMQVNPRYHWLGELPRQQFLRRLARGRLMVLSSKMEGGANVISESIVHGVPVLATRISGSIGLLGPNYPGYFPVGDTEALRRKLLSAERDPTYYQRLKAQCAARASRFEPARERESWKRLLRELV